MTRCKTCGRAKQLRAGGQCGACFWAGADKVRIRQAVSELARVPVAVPS